jgi:ABC-type uncharacterized transport system substrate-binding protein
MQQALLPREQICYDAAPHRSWRAMTFGTRLRVVTIVSAGAFLVLSGRPAHVAAHPHVWIDAVVTFVFSDRHLVGLRHRWKFDEFFGSFVIEENDVDGDGAFDAAEISAIRESAFSSLREYDYFTHLRVNGAKLPLDEASGFTARIEDGVLVYEFTMHLPAPVDPVEVALAASVYDVEYYVEVLLDRYDPVRFEGIPSGGCTYDIREDTENPIYYGMVYPLAITVNCATS